MLEISPSKMVRFVEEQRTGDMRSNLDLDRTKAWIFLEGSSARTWRTQFPTWPVAPRSAYVDIVESVARSLEL